MILFSSEERLRKCDKISIDRIMPWVREELPERCCKENSSHSCYLVLFLVPALKVQFFSGV
jgi:hypothetical protein